MLFEANWLVYGLLASIIASVHPWLGWFEVRFERSENRWSGFIGGIAVGYVTLYMLPKLSRVTVRFIAANPDAAWALQYRAYFILLLGIVVYLVFERVSRMSAGGANAARWLEIGVLGLYGFLIGYVAVELPRSEIRFHVLANVILALHLMGMVHRLRRHHPSAHAGWGRIGFALLVVFGYVLGVVTELHEFIIVDATAFTAGVILVNIMSEELPRGKEGHLRYFLMGVGVFAAVSILIPRT